jgi:hypothetical protein
MRFDLQGQVRSEYRAEFPSCWPEYRAQGATAEMLGPDRHLTSADLGILGLSRTVPRARQGVGSTNTRMVVLWPRCLG